MLNALILVILILLLIGRTNTIIHSYNEEAANKQVEEQLEKCKASYNALTADGEKMTEQLLSKVIIFGLICICLFFFYLANRFDIVWFILLTAILIGERIWTMTKLPHFCKIMIDSGFDWNLLRKFYPYSVVRTWTYTALECVYYVSAIILLVRK